MPRGTARGSNPRQRTIYGRENVNYAGPGRASTTGAAADDTTVRADWAPSGLPAAGNVSAGTDLCEYGICDAADVVDVADLLATYPDGNRPTALHGKSAGEIADILDTWRNDAMDTLNENFSPAKVLSLTPANTAGNFSASDLTALLSDGREVPVECKFGASTNAAAGIKRISEVLGQDAFTLSPTERAELLNLYDPADPAPMRARLREIMDDYVDDFEYLSERAFGSRVDGAKVYDMIHSSGKAGNSAGTSGYTVLNFRDPDSTAGSSVKTTSLMLEPEDEWEVSVSVSDRPGASLRLNYVLTCGDKKIRMTYNNKNSTYVVPDGDGGWTKTTDKSAPGARRVESRFQVGAGSYNVWYSEGTAAAEDTDEATDGS